MDEYIKREAAMDIFGDVPMWRGYGGPYRWEVHCALVGTVKLVKEEISKIPAADVAPVVHGEWETVDWLEYDAQSCETIRCPEEGIACTRCRYVFKKDALWKRNYCPNCGARMDEEER